MQNPFSRHLADRFFSSLKQVEERLASEEEKSSDPARPVHQSPPSSEDLSSPLYLGRPEAVPAPAPSLLPDSSGPPPQEFLSSSPQGHATGEDAGGEDDDDDDIEQLMALLQLRPLEEGASGSHSRLDGWIEYYARERKEPARLAHLLLAKAALLGGGDDDDELTAVEFPETVKEFLQYDSPPLGR